MIKTLEKTGRTEDDAINAALAELGLDRDDVSVEILERAKSGFLGIGASPAVVRVSYEAEDEPAPVEETVVVEAVEVEVSAPAADEPADYAAVRQFLTGLLDRMGVKANIAISARDNGGINVELSGSGMGAIIGRRGETLDAIQHLTNYVVNRGSDTHLHITLEDAKAVTQRSAMRYDRGGDEQYDCLSALMKSIRGSDPDAAIHYLARFLEAGELPACCRRILCSACEDIGLAYPQAIPIVKACVDAALQLGMPEARLPLADAVIFLATCPKSNSGYLAVDAALRDVRQGKVGPFPRELQNVHADSAGQEREQGYLYPHDFPNHWVRQQYLPDNLVGTTYYHYGANKIEQAAKHYWDEIKG